MNAKQEFYRVGTQDKRLLENTEQSNLKSNGVFC